METEKSGVWTLPNGEKITVTLKVLPDGEGRFGGVYVAATPSLASGRPSAATVSVTVEDDEGNAYTYTPVVPNMGLFAKLPARFFAADYPVGNGPLPSRLVWRVTGASLYSDDWEEATGEPFELAYYPAGRVGASGECLTEYPWRWWWGEDCEAPLPISRALIPTEGNPLPVWGCEGTPDQPSPSAMVVDPLSRPFLITSYDWHSARYPKIYTLPTCDDEEFISYLVASAQTADERYDGFSCWVDGLVTTADDHIFLQVDSFGKDGSRLLGDYDFCVGLITDLEASDFSVSKENPDFGTHEPNLLSYDNITLYRVEGYELGYTTTGCGTPVNSLIWLRLRVEGVRQETGEEHNFYFKISFTRHNTGEWTTLAVGIFGNAEPPVNPYTGNYAPFVIGGGACRDDILNSPKHRGRLTHMRLPDCDIDYYIKWWDNSGACYVLPYSIVGGKTEGRQDGSPLYQDTQILRLASPLLTVDERKDAMTIAESPRVAIRPYGGEWSYARLKDYSVSWEAGEEGEATLEIEVIANYGES